MRSFSLKKRQIRIVRLGEYKTVNATGKVELAFPGTLPIKTNTVQIPSLDILCKWFIIYYYNNYHLIQRHLKLCAL